MIYTIFQSAASSESKLLATETLHLGDLTGLLQCPMKQSLRYIPVELMGHFILIYWYNPPAQCYYYSKSFGNGRNTAMYDE